MIEKTFDTGLLTLDGPDLSGKTSLYQALHKKTDYEYNIQDRSSLSMVCFARQFNRPVSSHRTLMEKEYSNLNNRSIVLLPSFDTLKARFEARGDDIQDLTSLKVLHEIFTEEVENLKNLPTVYVVNENLPLDIITEKIINWLQRLEYSNINQVGEIVRDFVVNSGKDEHLIDINISGPISKVEKCGILSHPDEGSYYKEILWDFENTIKKEIAGLNPYSQAQNKQSRRFYYSSDTCISSLHLMPRGTTAKFVCSLRSTDVVRNASIDLSFLQLLVNEIVSKYFLECKNWDARIRFNSAHVRRDLKC